jgi:hypothetical protein
VSDISDSQAFRSEVSRHSFMGKLRNDPPGEWWNWQTRRT